ncbi:MAG: hypothetical protein QOE13_3112, partial [Gaiellaceae bacterium]|nr:hypothetical protein [Gaiellaceae bacterium]
IGHLDVVAPKRYTIKKGRRLQIALSPDGPGKATIALVKGGKVVARAAATFANAGTFGLKVKLPNKLKPGKYKLQISFTAAGTTKAVSKSFSLKVVGAAKKAAAARAMTGRAHVSGGAPYGAAPVHRRGIPRTVLG